MSVDELSKKNPDGTRLGQAAADKVSFYGATPVVQPDITATLAGVTTQTGLTSGIGFSTITQFQDFVTSFVEVRDKLVTLGLLSAS